MAQQTLPLIASTVQSDTNATKNTLVARDGSGGIYGTIVQGNDLVTTGYFTGSVSAQTASFTAGASVNYTCDCTSAAITVTLPLASANAGVEYWFTKIDSVTGHALTFATPLGTTSITAQYSHVRIFSDGSNWYSAA
jgi:hypothetical protein